MDFIFFSFTIATLLVNSESSNNIKGHTFELLNNERCETNNLLAILSNVRSRQICIGTCATLAQCARVNYAKSSKTCELIPSNETTCTTAIDTNWDHAYFKCRNQHNQDCQTLRENDCRQNGVYTIKPDPSHSSFRVFCDMQDGGWTVIQRRRDGTVNFHKKDWAKYRDGFGPLYNEYWLGNDYIHVLTNAANYQIKFDLMTPDNKWHDAIYSHFSINDETNNYKLSIGTFISGSAIDGFWTASADDQLDGMKFSTSDRDNDLADGVCTNSYNGAGWWYNSCSPVNLNMKYSHDGVFHNRSLGIKWRQLASAEGGPSLMATTMKLKRET